ncbi:hypothetical protein H0H81_011613 [Sphagnurus paluster]|uniref:Fungal-type protein kinase domain-containing protein n=1 Tax=Sphagnurus paluster TaxID=117069 RepID=A0A9P7KKH4_9AGAR|nr:hypothetical protein H0H81_011613 [Sphagnurus paluster]
MPSDIPRNESDASPFKFPPANDLKAEFLTLEEYRAKLNLDMASVFLGPMPPLEFLKFLAPAKKSPPKIDLVAKFRPKFKIVDTSNSSNAAIGDGWRIKPEPTMYHHEAPTDDGNLTQFDKMELHLEFKLRVSPEPFKDPPADLKDRSGWAFESSSAEGSDYRAQLIHYATEWCSRQHRVFAFSLFIAGTCMRFIRWDRPGAIVSELFDFHKQPDLLVEFLWRFSHLDHVGRGFDPTVRLASPAEAMLAREALAAWDPNTETPVVVFTIPGESTDEDGNTPMREFMAWASMSYPDGLIGRCTRAYPVYEKATRKLFFVKDSWRAWDLEEEAKILFELNEHEVEFIPPFTCGGDIDRERNATMTDLFIPMEDLDSDSDEPLADRSRDSAHPQDDHADEPNLKLLPPRRDSPWKCGDNWERITRRIHHRFAVAFIGQHLENFKNSRHLTQVASHTFTGES